MSEIIHLQMRLEIIRCPHERVERYAGIINENIHFGIVALWNYTENLWRFYLAEGRR